MGYNKLTNGVTMKKWAKFLCCFALLGAFLVGGLAGCGPTVNIQNNSSELIYNGNAAAVVASGNDNFVFFGNAYASTAPTNKSEYSSAKEYSYLARVNGKNLEAKNAYFSPKQVDNISDEVTAYEDSFMFVLGQNVYYATPNLQMVSQDGEAAYHYEYTCFYKSDLNGGGKHKLFTTTGEVSNIEVLKSGETYYIVMLAGENLVTINLSNDSATTIASGVTSVALPKTYRQDVVGSTLDWNGIIYFTTERENTSGSGATTNLVKKIVVTAKNEDEAQEVYTQGTVTFIARERDVLFFTDTVANSQKAVYMVDMSGAASNSAFLPSSNKRKAIYEGSSVTESSVSDLHLVTMTTYSGEQSTNIVRGYVYKTGSAFRFLTHGRRHVLRQSAVRVRANYVSCHKLGAVSCRTCQNLQWHCHTDGGRKICQPQRNFHQCGGGI